MIDQTKLWDVVGVVFIAEYVLPPLGRAAKALFGWVRDLRDLRNDLYENEEGDEDAEEEEGEDDA